MAMAVPARALHRGRFLLGAGGQAKHPAETGTTAPSRQVDELVYEALHSKWSRYHANYCGCGQD